MGLLPALDSNSHMTITTLADLTPDPKNARRHNPRNLKMITDSLQEVGAARSIVVDENGVILAGNGVAEAAGYAGIERVRVVPADGNEIIAVQRTGLTAKQKKRLALADNRTQETSDWDADVLAEYADKEKHILAGLFDDKELAELVTLPQIGEWADAFGQLPNGDRAPFQQITFTLHDSQAEQVKTALAASKHLGPFVDSPNENSNGNAITRICETFLTEHGNG